MVVVVIMVEVVVVVVVVMVVGGGLWVVDRWMGERGSREIRYDLLAPFVTFVRIRSDSTPTHAVWYVNGATHASQPSTNLCLSATGKLLCA
jgi:hypothetical protein